MPNLAMVRARSTFSPVKSQQRPEERWLEIPLLSTLSEKWVSRLLRLSLLTANLLMSLLAMALRIALSAGVP